MDRTGQVLEGKYRLVRLLGEGGMGSVYEAQHEIIGRRCAVKFLHPEIARNAEVVKRFVREAQAASAIGHPGIIDIYDVGTTPDGAPYLVMEFLDGRPLASYLGGGRRLPPVQAVELIAQALAALAAAHRRGVVHRDLKPDNLYVVERPGMPSAVKLLDFGISKFTQGGRPEDRMTRTGTVLGTPYYMAPEQAAGRPDVDYRLDLYAMGVILYECLTGRVPFEGENYNQVMVRILTEDPLRPRALEPSIPEGLEEVVLRAMERDRERRYGSAEEMLRALVRFLPAETRARLGLPPGDTDAARMLAGTKIEGEPRLTRTPLTGAGAVTALGRAMPSRGRRWLPLAAAAGLTVVVAAVLLVWRPWRRDSSSNAGPQVAAAVAADAAVAREPVRAAAPADAEVEKETRPEPAVDGGAAEKTAADAAGEAAAQTTNAAPVPGRVTIALKDLPAEAEVLYDGKVMPELPLSVERGTTGATVEVRAPGYETWRSVVVPDRDIEVAVRMEPRAAARDAGRAGGRDRTTGRADTGVSTTAQAAATSPPDAGARAAEAGTTLTQAGRGTVVMTNWDEEP